MTIVGTPPSGQEEGPFTGARDIIGELETWDSRAPVLRPPISVPGYP